MNALRVFEAAARHRSFARAAEELCVTHVAVSRQIRLLEERLDIPLFERRHRGVVLTTAGEEYHAALAGAFEEIIAATERLIGGRNRARLRIETDAAMAARWLGPRLVKWHDAYPDVDVEILPPRQNGQTPAPGSVDAVIYYGDANWPGMKVDRLLVLDAFPVCSPEIARQMSKPADLSNHVLLHEESTRWWREWLAAAGAVSVDWTRGPIYHDTNAILEACVRGEGIAIGDDVLWSEALASQRLVRPFGKGPYDVQIESATYDLLIPINALSDQIVVAFRGWILAEAGAKAA